MITLVRTISIHDGKLGDAIAWSVKVTNYIVEKHGLKGQVNRNIGGAGYQIHFVSSYHSLADFEKAMKQVEADPGYMALVLEARQQGLFIGASVKDALYESIP